MPRTRAELREERRQLRTLYVGLFDSVAALLFRYDPIGISGGDNIDEYEPEAGTILPRLHTCQSVEDVLPIVHDEFVRWFGANTAGQQERYKEIASEIWQIWKEGRTNIRT
jgi:hypothetical protein